MCELVLSRIHSGLSASSPVSWNEAQAIQLLQIAAESILSRGCGGSSLALGNREVRREIADVGEDISVESFLLTSAEAREHEHVTHRARL